MKKFLVATSIGGAKLHKAAWDYLVSNITKKLDQEDYIMKCQVYSCIWHDYFIKYGIKDEDGEYVIFQPWLEGADGFRDTLLKLVEELECDYAKLDELNDGRTLRIVTVPNDGYEYHITEDPEYGSEYVTQYHRSFFPEEDWLALAKAKIKKFSNEITSKMNGVFSIDHTVEIATSAEHGLAKVHDEKGKDHYLFLKYSEYYVANDDHPKSCYEIVNADLNAWQPITYAFSKEQLEKYIELYKLLN